MQNCGIDVLYGSKRRSAYQLLVIFRLVVPVAAFRTNLCSFVGGQRVDQSVTLSSPIFRRQSTSSRGRRQFLTLAGTGIIGGLVLRLDREARGQSSATPRHVLYNTCNGLTHSQLNKSKVNGPTNFTLNGFMSEFEPFKDDLTVLQNMYCGPGRYLHGNSSSALSCTKRGKHGGGDGKSNVVVGGKTIDQTIADHIQQESPLRSVVLGHPVVQRSNNCIQGTVLGRALNEPVYPTLDPMKAHALVFGETNQDEVLVELEQSYLDFVKDDIAAYSASLPSQESQKVGQYLESFREIEKTLSGGALGGCQALPTETFGDVGAGIGGKAGHFSDNNPKFWRYMADLGVAALQCGATRQLTMLHSYGCTHLHYTFDGQKKNHHAMCHNDQGGAFVGKILGFHTETIAYMYGKLKEIPEGAGSMADSVLFQWMSDGGGSHHNGTKTHPTILLGRANGRVKGGQWLKLDPDKVPLGNAHVTAAQAMGLEINEFGDGSDPVNGPVAGVLS